MTDEQIIKALECCATDDGDDCFQCPYCNLFFEPGNGGCVNRCRKDALDLINRQKAEIERLQSRNKFLEIEYKNMSNLFQTRIQTSTIETIKEFAERLKETAYSHSDISGYQSIVVDADTIDNLVKEMAEVWE